MLRPVNRPKHLNGEEEAAQSFHLDRLGEGVRVLQEAGHGLTFPEGSAAPPTEPPRL